MADGLWTHMIATASDSLAFRPLITVRQRVTFKLNLLNGIASTTVTDDA